MASSAINSFDEITNNITIKFEKMKNDFINKITEAISSVKNEINVEIDKIFREIEEVKKNMHDLHDRIDFLERDRISCDMVISGIPSLSNITPEDHFNAICKAIGIDRTETVNIFRVARKNTSTNNNQRTVVSPIIVRFRNSAFKSKFFAKYKQFKNLKLSDIGIAVENRIFCNDGLTRKNSIIFKRAKALQHSNEISRAFTWNGVVHVVLEQNSSPILIKQISQLQNFKQLPNSMVSDQVLEPLQLNKFNNNTDVGENRRKLRARQPQTNTVT